MKIWITGIAGFLGSHLADALLAVGHNADGNDNELCHSSGHNRHPIDCRNFEFMKTALQRFNPDVLIHCAATAHEGLSNFSPSFITKNIYEASVSTFSAAIAAGIKRIVFMSSMARYGGGYSNLSPPFFENMHEPNPIDPYGIAKVAAEKTLIALCKLHKVEYVIAVPHNIIGPRQKYDDPYRNVASIMINRALQDKPIIIYGDGEQKRSFSPIADCLDSLVKMIDAPISGEVINIGPEGGEITINQLADKIISLTKNYAGIQHVDGRPNEVKEAWCSSAKARKLLDFNPSQSIHDCLKEMVAYIKENGTKPFQYNFPIEIERGCPTTWLNRTI